MVRRHVLSITPVDMHIDEVVEIISREWGRNAWVRDHGLAVFRRTSPSSISPDTIGWGNANASIIGSYSIASVDIGQYRTLVFMLPHIAHVRAYWAFCEDGKLIDVFVTRGYGT